MPGEFFTAYVDLLCPVNSLVRGSIVPPANTAAELLLKSQIPPAIMRAHPATSVLAHCMLHLTFLENIFKACHIISGKLKYLLELDLTPHLHSRVIDSHS